MTKCNEVSGKVDIHMMRSWSEKNIYHTMPHKIAQSSVPTASIAAPSYYWLGRIFYASCRQRPSIPSIHIPNLLPTTRQALLPDSSDNEEEKEDRLGEQRRCLNSQWRCYIGALMKEVPPTIASKSLPYKRPQGKVGWIHERSQEITCVKWKNKWTLRSCLATASLGSAL